MNKKLQLIFEQKPYLKQYLKEESYEYKYLYRDLGYIKEIDKKAKEKYQLTSKDKIEKLKNRLELFQTIMSVMN